MDYLNTVLKSGKKEISSIVHTITWGYKTHISVLWREMRGIVSLPIDPVKAMQDTGVINRTS